MTTTASSRRRRDGHADRLRAVIGARAVVAALLAIAVTFTLHHTPQFGLLVLGLFEVVQAAVLLLGLRVAQRGRRARVLLVARSAVLLLVGVLALALPGAVVGPANELVLLVALESVAFLAGGVLELVGGLGAGESALQRRDAVTMGGLQVVAAVMLIVLNPDPVFTIGVLGCWGAITAVYLGIAAASVGRTGVR